ncbi:MAG: DUF2799 domain-containing protein [Hyphomonadaceae bacterium]|nr:DUF2799 domain-containing protein [Hyphomonadaceae bacterium]
MRIAIIMAAGVGALALAACETTPRPAMTSAQCAVADWKAVGYQDGAEGRPPERFVARQQACIDAGYGADQAAYMAGRREGLWNWCQPERAFRLGMDGAGYNGVCPPELDGAFRDAHNDGRRANQALSAFRSAESALSSLRNDRQDIERKIDANEAGLIASQTDEERLRHRNELVRLREERARIDGRIREADDTLRESDWTVQRVRREIGFRYGSW